MSRKLKRPPIRELVIDIRAATQNDTDVNNFLDVQKEISQQYPKQKKINAMTGEFNIADPARIKQINTVLGYVFSSVDGHNLVQCRKNGFTINRVGNYQETSFLEELKKAKKYWEIYKDIAKPTSIDRIAVRVINDLELPLKTDPSEYLNVLPIIPPAGKVSQVEAFFNRQQFVWDTKYKVNFILAYEGKISAENLSLVLDIDLYKELPNSINEDEMWETFSELNDGKNQIFRSSLSEKGLGLFL